MVYSRFKLVYENPRISKPDHESLVVLWKGELFEDQKGEKACATGYCSFGVGDR
jgi:hypothetical protein